MSLMRVERTTFRLGGECSIQLSYRLKKIDSHSKKNKKSYKRVERTTFWLGEHKKGEYLERFLCVFIIKIWQNAILTNLFFQN